MKEGEGAGRGEGETYLHGMFHLLVPHPVLDEGEGAGRGEGETYLYGVFHLLVAHPVLGEGEGAGRVRVRLTSMARSTSWYPIQSWVRVQGGKGAGRGVGETYLHGALHLLVPHPVLGEGEGAGRGEGETYLHGAPHLLVPHPVLGEGEGAGMGEGVTYLHGALHLLIPHPVRLVSLFDGEVKVSVRRRHVYNEKADTG